MTRFLQASVGGLSLGALYALLALGFVIIYKSSRVISFAQSALMIFGAYWVVYFATVIGLNFWLALVLAIAIGGLFGVVIERVVLRPMVGQPVFSVAILTIGLDIAIRVWVNDLIGVQLRSVGDPWGFQIFRLGDVVIQHADAAAVIITTVVVAALLLFFRYTRIGLAMRATAFDQEVALAQGIPVTRVFALAWALAAGLAAIAGMFAGAGAGIDQSTAFIALKSLPVVIIGGLESIGGAVVAGLLVGLFENYAAVYQPSVAPWLGQNFSIVVPYVLMFLVLLVRPYGFFGTEEIERV